MDDKQYRGEVRVAGMADQGTGGSGHTLSVINREQLQVTGVLAVDNFDDEEVVLETELGVLTIRGEDLHIKQLDLESGRFAVEGYVNLLQYSTPRQRQGRPSKGRGFLERLLR
ncbi:MAG: sporulation protein YabP [Bacillota bacterium]